MVQKIIYNILPFMLKKKQGIRKYVLLLQKRNTRRINKTETNKINLLINNLKGMGGNMI